MFYILTAICWALMTRLLTQHQVDKGQPAKLDDQESSLVNRYIRLTGEECLNTEEIF